MIIYIMEKNNNLVSIDKLKNVIKQKGLMKYVKEINYSKAKGKKYYIISVDDKKVNFGSLDYPDYLIHKDKARRLRFRQRFNKLFNKFSEDYNKPIFWAYRILW